VAVKLQALYEGNDPFASFGEGLGHDASKLACGEEPSIRMGG
jgi:hypothetical protein